MVELDYETISEMKRRNLTWRLLLADSAPLIIGFLNEVFVQPNVRVIPEPDLVEKLEDFLCAVHDAQGATLFPRPAAEYLKEWAEPEKEWLRRFHPLHSDEPHYDLTPSSERAVRWVASLSERAFIGAESRLKTAFDLLSQIAQGVETDPEVRVAELEKRRLEIDREIERIRRGDSVPMDDTALKERFMQFTDTASALLGDFRSVELNFRKLDREVRRKIAVWGEGKGALLGEILSAHDVIESSDQGRSFRAFSDFLLLRSSQQDFNEKLAKVLAQPAIRSLEPDERIGRILYNWVDAADHVLRTVAQLSSQMRVFLDNRAWLENRRIAEILRRIESSAVEIRDERPSGVFMELDGDSIEIELPLERPLYNPSQRISVRSEGILPGEDLLDGVLAFDRDWVDTDLLLDRVLSRVRRTGQISLGALLEEYPLEKGLDELLGYFAVALALEGTVFDESESESVLWYVAGGPDDTSGASGASGAARRMRVATIPKIIFTG